ncbi:MAG TPA: YhjD/YihY/BrkB family envelope integrity protein [Verrucomicrobiae bacterium]|nr:YhjD/YihY/BrkB family envelope integrity protein [Verrucomicrobiae bacterium]
MRLIKIVVGGQTGAESEFDRLEHFAHFWALVWKSFVRNRCLVRASALSYTTLLALIPLLAVAIGVTSSLLKKQGEQQIYKAIDKMVANFVPPTGTNAPVAPDLIPKQDELTPTNPQAASVMTNFPPTINAIGVSPNETNSVASLTNDERVISAQKEVARNIHDFIHRTRSGALGLTGMVLLIFAAISMFNRIENAFNDIWGVARGRNWITRIVLYWTAITLGPLVIAVALGLAGGTHLQATRALVEKMPLVGGLIFNVLPLVVLWLAFALIYQLVPNTKVRFNAALVGGVVGGTLWQLNNVFGFLYVSRVVTNSKIYGSLGLVPVFMVGLYFSWVILLFGAQVAYAFQNRKAYLQNKLMENVSHRGREFIALRLMTCVGQRFQNGKPPVTIQEISTELGIPTKLAQQVLQTLLAARLVVETNGGEHAYAPARPLDLINAHHILLAMRAGGGQELLSRDEPVRAEIFGEFARIEEAEKQAASAVTLLALVHRAQSHLEIAAPATEVEKQIPLPPETKS